MIAQRFGLFVSIFLLSTGLLRATSNHEYGPDEYVTVSNGISPDGRWAITAHGGGDLGYNDFHLYLTEVATGKNVGPLKAIKEILDSGADAFAAQWSKDSRLVTIVYRVDRHAPLKAVSYRITQGKAQHLKGPFDVKSEALIKYWQDYGSGLSVSPKVFGAPLKQK